MAGGVAETDPEKLAEHCDNFKIGTQKRYEESNCDMWLFELYNHLTDCANALRSMTKGEEK